MSGDVKEVVTDMPVEVSMVTEVSSEAVDLPSMSNQTNRSDSESKGAVSSESVVPMELSSNESDLITGQSNEADKRVAMDTVQYDISEVVASDSNMLIDSNSELSSVPSEPPHPSITEFIQERDDIVSYAKLHSITEASEKFKVPLAFVKLLIKDKSQPVFNSPGQGRKLSYSTEKDEAIAKHIRELLASGEKVSVPYICQYAKSLIQEENPQFTASSGWAQRFLIRHSIDIGRQKGAANPKTPENRGRPLSYSVETDKQLAEYVRSRISEGQMFTNSELRKHAREVVTKENPNFTGSASWAQNFLHRHKISLQSMAYESTESGSLLTQSTPSPPDNPIGPAAEITPTTSHPSIYSDPSHEDPMKTALAILAAENIDSNAALQSSLSEMTADSVSLVDLLTNAQQLQDASDDGGVSLITSGLESPSGSIYLNLGGTEGFAGGFSTQVDPNTQAPVPQEPARSQQLHDVVAQASRPLSYTRETDQQLAKWVQEQQAMGRKVTFASLRAQAKKLICQENPNFNASIGWVTPFLLRHNLDLSLNKKKRSPQKTSSNVKSTTLVVEGDKTGEEDPQIHTSGTPIITPDILATAIATSLAEQVGTGLTSLADQARLVLTQSGLAITTSPQNNTAEIPAKAATTKSDTRPESSKQGSGKRDKSRNRHTLAEKLEVVRLMKEYNVAAHYVCRTLGIANSTFAGWTKLVSQKGAELEALSSNRKRANVKGQGRPLSYSKETDEAIAKWVRAQQQLGVQVTPAELGKYATALISQESPNFTASSGWQQKFLQRHNLQLYSTWSQKTAPATTTEDKLAAEDQTNIPAPIQTEEVVANEFKPTPPEWSFGSEVDTELAKWVKEQVQEHGSFSVGAVCKKAEEVCQNSMFEATLGWAFKFLHQHSIMLDPKPTISQLCATALNRKRASSETVTTPKKPCPADPTDLTVSPSTGNLCEALLALSNQNSTEGGEPSSSTMQAAIQSLQTAVAQVIQQQQLQEGGEPGDKSLLESIPLVGSPIKDGKVDTPISQSSNTYFGKPAREFSSDEKEEVVRYANATTLQKAALKYGVAAPTVWRWRVELKLHQPKYTTMQKKYIIKFAEANSLKEASTRYGISGKTIQNWRKSFVADGDVGLGNLEEVPAVSMTTGGGGPESIETSAPPQSTSEPTTSEVVTYDTQNFQFIVDGGEVVESSRRPDLPPSQSLVHVEPLSLEVTNEVDIENVGMEYDIVSSEGHAAKPRCTPEEKEHILQFALDHSVREASNKYGISQGTLYYWKKNMSSSGAGTMDTSTLTTTSSGPVVNVPVPVPFTLSAESELLQSGSQAGPARNSSSSIADQYITTSASSGLTSESLQSLPSYVSFLNTVSSLLTSESEQDKSKSTQILNSTSGGISSPTEVLVTPFTSEPQSDIETTATVTVVTSGGGGDQPPLSNETVPIEEQVVEVRDKPAETELSMPSETGGGLETINVEEVDISQTVELVESEVQEGGDNVQ